MTYLIVQTFILLLIAGLLGLVFGWYLTRMAAAGARASLQARVKSAEADARALRAELDAAVNARGTCEAERKQLGDELAALREAGEVAAGQADAIATLQAELADCRSALAAAQAAPSAQAAEAVAPLADPVPAVADEALQTAAPPRYQGGDDRRDDLQQIKGIGPKIAGILNDLGIVRFEQIAAWTPQNVGWVNDHLRFKGRIEREEWIPQAKALAASRDAEG